MNPLKQILAITAADAQRRGIANPVSETFTDAELAEAHAHVAIAAAQVAGEPILNSLGENVANCGFPRAPLAGAEQSVEKHRLQGTDVTHRRDGDYQWDEAAATQPLPHGLGLPSAPDTCPADLSGQQTSAHPFDEDYDRDDVPSLQQERELMDIALDDPHRGAVPPYFKR